MSHKLPKIKKWTAPKASPPPEESSSLSHIKREIVDDTINFAAETPEDSENMSGAFSVMNIKKLAEDEINVVDEITQCEETNEPLSVCGMKTEKNNLVDASEMKEIIYIRTKEGVFSMEMSNKKMHVTKEGEGSEDDPIVMDSAFIPQ